MAEASGCSQNVRPKAGLGRAAMGRTEVTVHTQRAKEPLVEKRQYLNQDLHWEELIVSSCVFLYQASISELQKS